MFCPPRSVLSADLALIVRLPSSPLSSSGKTETPLESGTQMRTSKTSIETPRSSRREWRVVPLLVPYLLDYKLRVGIALVFLTAAKLANVAVPLVLKEVVDSLSPTQAVLALPLALLVAYGALRLATTLFAELRDLVFVRVTQRAIRRIALSVFRHLHALSLRFHLERQTGGVSRDIERGTRGISTMLSYMLFSIIPVILEFTLVAVVLLAKFDWRFVAVTFAAVIVYILFTVGVTEWRMDIRRRANELDSRANTRAIDSLLNYETVKYFNNEEYEAKRYDENLRQYENAAVRTEASLGALNIGQSFIIAIAVTALMVLAAEGVVGGTLTLGDLVLINGLLIQLYIPLNFLGMVYREIKQALADMDRMFRLLEENREIEDRPNAVPLPTGPASIRFENVDFSYDARRQILHDVTFNVPAGYKVAVVGPSGSGKSTLARLLYRFYDVSSGSVRVNGVDIRAVTQTSLRGAIAIVPQDTVLFNDTIYYNIRYGRPEATRKEVIAAAQAAHIHDFIESLPDGYDARVGERGLKLSGGEKTACGDRPRDSERSAHTDIRRSDLGLGFAVRASNSSGTRSHCARAHDAGDCTPTFHDHGCGSDTGDGPRTDHRGG